MSPAFEYDGQLIQPRCLSWYSLGFKMRGRYRQRALHTCLEGCLCCILQGLFWKETTRLIFFVFSSYRVRRIFPDAVDHIFESLWSVTETVKGSFSSEWLSQKICSTCDQRWKRTRGRISSHGKTTRTAFTFHIIKVSWFRITKRTSVHISVGPHTFSFYVNGIIVIAVKIEFERGSLIDPCKRRIFTNTFAYRYSFSPRDISIRTVSSQSIKTVFPPFKLH